MPATVASTNAPRLHLASMGSRPDIAALRSSTGRTSPWSELADARCPEAPRGEVNVPSSRALHVWGLLLPLPAEEVMPDSGYRCHQGAPNRPTAAVTTATQATVVVRQIPKGRLAQLVRAQPSHG